MNPKHHNPTMKRRDKDGNEFWAHAPYNFVPLPEKVVTVDAEAIPSHDVYTEYTGYIDCILETRSPLYTRCAMSPDFFKEWAERIQKMMCDDTARNKYAQFFHLDDAQTPVIPGSSLRGMVRTLVEIVGYGKMQWVTGEPLVFRAIGDTTSLGNYYRSRLLRDDGNKHFLSYNRSPLDLVPKLLRSADSIDLPEAIFGFVPQGKEDLRQARAGRVFFTEARLEPQQASVWEAQVTPKILSGPKPTTFQHYLTQQEPDKVDSGKRYKNGNPKMELRLDHYDSPPPHETVIRGHKLYWHRDSVTLCQVQETSPVDWSTDTQHTSIRPVKADVRFRFRIYFENLRDFELGALLWALVLPGEDGKDYCHSLGMGKPLGMGAVKIAPTLYLSDRKSRYRRLFGETDWHRDEREEKNIEQFIRAFENFILQRMDTQERGQAQSLKEVERIKMLLKMLEWPGPDRQLTEYMTIEPINEYKERPVLPDPLHIGEPLGNTFPSTVRQVVKPRDKGKRKKRHRR